MNLQQSKTTKSNSGQSICSVLLNFPSVNSIHKLQSTINELSIQNHRQYLRLESSTLENTSLKKQLSIYSEEFAHVQSSLNDREIELEECKREFSECFEEMQRMKKLLDRLPKVKGRPCVEALVDSNKHHVQDLQKLREQNIFLKSNFEGAQKQLKHTKVKYENQVQEQTKQIDKLKQKLLSDITEYSVKKQLAQLKEQKQEAEKSIVDWKKKYANLEVQNHKLLEQVGQKRRELYRRQEYILYHSEPQSSQSHYQSIIDDLRRTNQELVEKQNSALMKNTKMFVEMGKLTTTLEEYKKEILYKNQKINEMQQQHSHLLEELKERKHELNLDKTPISNKCPASIISLLDQREQQTSVLTLKVEQLKQELSEKKKINKSTIEQLMSIKEENHELLEKYEKVTSQILSLKDVISVNAKDAYYKDKKIRNLQQKAQLLSQELESIQQRSFKLQKDFEKISKQHCVQYPEVEIRLKRSTSQLHNMSQQQQILRDQYSNLMREKNKLSKRNEQLMETLNKTKDRIQVLEEENFILREEKQLWKKKRSKKVKFEENSPAIEKITELPQLNIQVCQKSPSRYYTPQQSETDRTAPKNNVIDELIHTYKKENKQLMKFIEQQ